MSPDDVARPIPPRFPEEMPPNPERDRSFDNEAFFAAIDSERISRGLNWKELAAQAGVSASTLTRIGQGRRPDVDSFAALLSWGGLDADDFLARSPHEVQSTLTEISLLLRRDKNLSSDAASAIDELVKATYSRLQQER